MGTDWGDLRVGPCGTLTQTVPGLAGEVGCVRGQALPCMVGAAGLSRRIFPKRKRPSGALWGFPAATASVSSPPGHPPFWGVCAPTGVCVHLIWEGSETTGTNQGSVPSNQGVCPGMGKCMHPPESLRTHWGVCA